LFSSNCRTNAQQALYALRTALDVGKRQFGYGHLAAALRTYDLVAKNLGRLMALNSVCKLDAQEAIDNFGVAADELRDGISTACTVSHAASLSGAEIDPYEVYRKWRKPLPPQRSGPMEGKKGKKGHDRKRDKQRSKREEGW